MELRDLTEDLKECLCNAFIPQTLENEINSFADEHERERLRRKVKGGSMAALAVMGYFVTNRKHGFSKWPRDIKRCECAILRFLGSSPYDNYEKFNEENLKEYTDLQSNTLKYFVNDEILENAFEIAQGEHITHFLNCDIKKGTYEVFRCHTETNEDSSFRDEKEIFYKKNKTDNELLAMAQIIQENPILNADENTKKNYFRYLKNYIQLGGWKELEYVNAQVDLYSKILNRKKTGKSECDHKVDIEEYRYFLLFDLFYILGFDKKVILSDVMFDVMKTFASDFPALKTEKDVVMLIFDTISGNYGNWDKIKRHPLLVGSRKYIERIESNLKFQNTRQFRILVTATMSAGKSTLINAVTGKNLARTSQEVCTGSVCYLYNKPFEDGQTHLKTMHINLAASQENLMSYEWADTIHIAAYYNKMGSIEDRICIIDTPGVNNSVDQSHGSMTYKALMNETYDKVVYVFNGNKLGTDEEMSHLKWVSENVPKDKIVFVINKLDNFNSRDDSIADSIDLVRKELVALGYEEPVICPMSAYFALLIKMKHNGKEMTEDEQDEYDLQSVKFNRSSYDLSKYYEGVQNDTNDSVYLSMSKKCGLYGLEKILFGGRI